MVMTGQQFYIHVTHHSSRYYHGIAKCDSSSIEDSLLKFNQVVPDKIMLSIDKENWLENKTGFKINFVGKVDAILVIDLIYRRSNNA